MSSQVNFYQGLQVDRIGIKGDHDRFGPAVMGSVCTYKPLGHIPNAAKRLKDSFGTPVAAAPQTYALRPRLHAVAASSWGARNGMCSHAGSAPDNLGVPLQPPRSRRPA